VSSTTVHARLLARALRARPLEHYQLGLAILLIASGVAVMALPWLEG
jgi:hypothetical protein